MPYVFDILAYEYEKTGTRPAYHTKPERATGVEPASSAWKADIIAVIRRPQYLVLDTSTV